MLSLENLNFVYNTLKRIVQFIIVGRWRLKKFFFAVYVGIIMIELVSTEYLILPFLAKMYFFAVYDNWNNLSSRYKISNIAILA